MAKNDLLFTDKVIRLAAATAHFALALINIRGLTNMITLHHLENSQSLRILWLLEELEVDYEFVMYDRDPKRV